MTSNLDLNGKSILITGGTGSFGKKFVETILTRWPQVKRLVIYSRDELKQFEMAQHFPQSKYNGIRYFIGDIRDAERFRYQYKWSYGTTGPDYSSIRTGSFQQRNNRSHIKEISVNHVDFYALGVAFDLYQAGPQFCLFAPFIR